MVFAADDESQQSNSGFQRHGPWPHPEGAVQGKLALVFQFFLLGEPVLNIVNEDTQLAEAEVGENQEPTVGVAVHVTNAEVQPTPPPELQAVVQAAAPEAVNGLIQSGAPKGKEKAETPPQPAAEEKPECAVCWEPVDLEVFCPRGHSICKDCLSKLDTGCFSCPICREDIFKACKCCGKRSISYAPVSRNNEGFVLDFFKLTYPEGTTTGITLGVIWHRLRSGNSSLLYSDHWRTTHIVSSTTYR